jgi:predicted nucleic acid-binding protein
MSRVMLPWFARGLKLYGERRDKSWSLTDCISFEVMKDRAISDALTGDQHFMQAGFRALLVAAA